MNMHIHFKAQDYRDSEINRASNFVIKLSQENAVDRIGPSTRVAYEYENKSFVASNTSATTVYNRKR